MVVKENIKINNKDFIKHYSDEGYYIRKIRTDEIYAEAIDLIEFKREYEETDKKIEDNIETLEALGLNVDEYKS